MSYVNPAMGSLSMVFSPCLKLKVTGIGSNHEQAASEAHMARLDQQGHRVLDKHCESWGADHVSVMGQSSSLTSGLLLGQQTRSCSNQYIVLCIETHKNH
ncbi:hypothetical protein WMY93_031145 [Mugilogobius chulae]|uniref:Collagenase NC10/endostatin domain-containing protein n=1 Tax=Mugilogobius chulae TaxID=88201 RepID=A0AAW0MIR5_9GOBI